MIYGRMSLVLGLSAVCLGSGCAANYTQAGINYLEQENYTAAVAAFDSAAAVKPHPRIYYGYFEAYMGMKDYENAFKYLTIGLSKYPLDAWLNLCAGHWYMREGKDPRKALLCYEKAAGLRFGKSGSVMNEKINEYIGMAKDQIIVDSLENNLKE